MCISLLLCTQILFIALGNLSACNSSWRGMGQANDLNNWTGQIKLQLSVAYVSRKSSGNIICTKCVAMRSTYPSFVLGGPFKCAGLQNIWGTEALAVTA